MESSERPVETTSQHADLDDATQPLPSLINSRERRRRVSRTHRVDPYNDSPQTYQSSGVTGLVDRRRTRTHSVTSEFESQGRLFTTSQYTSSNSRSIARANSIKDHRHPLYHHVLPSYHQNTRPSIHISHDALSQPQGLTSAVRFALRKQAKRVAGALGSTQSKQREALTAKLFSFIILLLVMYISPTIMDYTTKEKDFKWSPNRRLNDRQCTLNMFIDKQAPDEFNPDFVEIKPGEKNKDGTPKLPKPPKLEKGTYRTEGQTKVIQRFISSVADSFRGNFGIQQHLLFAGTRDGGHLADHAMKHWPPRGKYRTQIHIVADGYSETGFDEALEYGTLSSIENRFQNHANAENVHIFDFHGKKAGLVQTDIDDDDVFILRQEEMFEPEDDDLHQDVELLDDALVIEDGEGRAEYISLKKLLAPFIEKDSPVDRLDDDEGTGSGKKSVQEERRERKTKKTREKQDSSILLKTEHVIPYFHVDGRTASQQFQILQSAKPLLIDNTIVTVGIEHAPDMDVFELIDFFHTVHYKTFFLGVSQITRVDHLCPEILEDVLRFPKINPPKKGRLRKSLQWLRIIPKDKDDHMVHPHIDNSLTYPPFFVAIPRGRHSKEEMTIQHMYDLFGGSGGGGQIATANDRKAPGKKKKKS